MPVSRGMRIKELLDEKAAGRKIIGFYCVFVPEEIVLAANATLGFALADFGAQALAAEKDLLISSMCKVFAESEVTSLIARGEDRKEIARGVHTSVIRRAAGMINRVSSEGPIVFTGGVAKTPCMVELLSGRLDREIRIPSDPQLAGSYGAALLAAETPSVVPGEISFSGWP
jgi:activator of 2-hydroxyglutaryl-CoA dehydratase